MLVFDKQKFKDSLTQDHLYGGFPAIQKYGISHNHSDLVYDYHLTDHFKKIYPSIDHSKYNYSDHNLWEESGKEIFHEILNKHRYWLQDQLDEYANTEFTKENTFAADKLVETAVLRYAEYLAVMSRGNLTTIFRFGDNKLHNVTHNPVYLEEFEELYTNYNNALNNIFPEKFDYQKLCAYCWISLEANYNIENVIEITSYYLNQISNQVWDSDRVATISSESNLVTHYTDDNTGRPRGLDNFWRAYLSISWPLAQSLKYFKRYDEASSIYKITKKLTKQHLSYSTGRNRIFEAAIEDYKLFPTQENKEWCYEMLHDVSQSTMDNCSENTNEIFLMLYMFYKHVLGKKLK